MSAASRCVIGLAGLLLLVFAPCSFARQSNGDTATRANQAFDSELNTLIGRAALSLGNTQFIETETMPGLMKLWDQRQTLGAGNLDLSNAFLFVMEENPQAFFVSMAAHPREFDDWLKELPYLSFTWYDAPPCQLETKQKQLILILQHTQIAAPDASRLKDEMLARLSTIKCRQIR